jgi:hypothetical protein
VEDRSRRFGHTRVNVYSRVRMRDELWSVGGSDSGPRGLRRTGGSGSAAFIQSQRAPSFVSRRIGGYLAAPSFAWGVAPRLDLGVNYLHVRHHGIIPCQRMKEPPLSRPDHVRAHFPLTDRHYLTSLPTTCHDQP